MRIKQGNKDKAIIKAAIEIFAEKGYHEAKISHIADKAGVAVGSIYTYFKNKEHLLSVIFEDIWITICDGISILIKNEELQPLEKFDCMLDLIFDKFTNDKGLTIVFVNEHDFILKKGDEIYRNYYQNFLDLGEEIIKQGISAGQIKSDLDLVILRAYFFGGVRFLLHQWASNPSEISIENLRSNVKILTKTGIKL